MLDFPASPANGQLFDAPNGVTYKWLLSPGIWTSFGPAAAIPPPPPILAGEIDLAALGVLSDGVDRTVLLNTIFATYGAASYRLNKVGSGNVLTTGTVGMPNGGALTMAADVVWEAAHISWLGSLGTEIPLTVAAARASTTFSCNTTGIAVGDWIFVKGCTNLGSIDALDDQLLWIASSGIFAGEWFQVKTVSVGSLTVFGGSRWPYSITAGPSSGTRTVSTIAKVAFTTGSIRGGTILTRNAGAFNEVVSIKYARDVTVEGVKFLDQSPPDPGDAPIQNVLFHTSLGCTIRNCSITRPPHWTGAVGVSLRNAIQVNGSTKISASGNYINGGAGGIDHDIVVDGVPCVSCSFTNNRVENALIAALCHEGNVQVSFTDNVAVNCARGMEMRSPRSIMSDNAVFGGDRTQGVGIYVRSGFIDQTVCIGNTVEGYLEGITVTFVPNGGAQVLPAHVVLRDNMVKNCVTGVRVINTGQANTLTRSVALLGGVIVSEPTITQIHLQLDSYIEITVDRVRFVGGIRFTTPLGAITIPVNVAVVNIGQNSFEDLGALINGVYGPGVTALTDAAVWPTGDAAAKWTVGRQTMLGTSGAATANMPAVAFGSAVAQLPVAASYVGINYYVTDALGPVVGSTVVGGGAVKVLAASNGTVWRVTAIL